MILPNNGKVVIIDDQPDDVVALMASLSKEKIPFVHYKEEDLSDLPDSPIENVRLVFLDLELVTDTYMSPKNITSPIKTRLIRVLKPNTAYALVIWSRKENDYKDALLKDFETEFKEYKPIFHTSLPKADILGREGAMAAIKRELEIEITNFKSFNAFLVWESIVNEASGKLTNEIGLLYPRDEEWNQKTKFLLYKLALAHSGKVVNNLDDVLQLKNALYTLTQTFTDNIENSINRIVTSEFSNLVSTLPQDIENYNTVINKLLLISNSSNNSAHPGNVYFTIEELQAFALDSIQKYEYRKDQIANLPLEKRSVAIEGLNKAYQKDRQNFEQRIAKHHREFNEMAVSAMNEDAANDKQIKDTILDSMIGIELNITPLCDYAQEKARLYRLLPGVIIKSEFRKLINSKPAYLYISDADFRLYDIDYLFLFDFRFLHAIVKEEINIRSSKFRLKHQFLSDIQQKLGSHVIRSGVLFVD